VFLAWVEAPETPPAETTELSVGIKWLGEPGDPSEVDSWLTAFLSLQDDLSPLYDAATGDDVFQAVVEDLYGRHHVRFPTPFECACWAALSQQTPMNLAKTQKRTLVEVAGQEVERDGVTHRLFPTPAMIPDRQNEIKAALNNERKSKTVLGAAELFANTDLQRLPNEELLARLESVWGFGEWSSEFVLLRGFGRLSRVPTSERRLRTVVAELYDLGVDEASEDDLRRIGDRYGAMRGYWAHYLRVWAFQRDE
jgi:DNA-3-methyladenine glycosylase II